MFHICCTVKTKKHVYAHEKYVDTLTKNLPTTVEGGKDRLKLYMQPCQDYFVKMFTSNGDCYDVLHLFRPVATTMRGLENFCALEVFFQLIVCCKHYILEGDYVTTAPNVQGRNRTLPVQ